MIGRTFPLFLLAGGVAALVNIAARWLLDFVMPYVASIVLAYLLGMVTAFLLNRRFVFTSAGNGVREQIVWFTIINLAAVAQTLVVSLALAYVVLPWLGWRWHPETVAHVIGVMVPVFMSYIGHKRLTFR